MIYAAYPQSVKKIPTVKTQVNKILRKYEKIVIIKKMLQNLKGQRCYDLKIAISVCL